MLYYPWGLSVSQRKSPARTTSIVRPSRPVVQAVAPSLPPARAGAARIIPSLHKPGLRRKAIEIIGLKSQGFSHAEIGERLRIKPGSVATILYRASKAGFLEDSKGNFLLDDPKDEVEYSLQHLATKNLRELMTSDQVLSKGDKLVKMEATLEVAKGTLFKKFDQPKEAVTPNMNVLAVKIELPSSGSVVAREGTMGGLPSYTVEGVVDGHAR